MKVWLIALNTFHGLVRRRALLALILLFLFVFSGAFATLFLTARLQRAGSPEQARLLLAGEMEGLMVFYAVLTQILAAILAAVVVPEEIKSGTAIPTLGRALSRSQFLLGQFLGMNLLLLGFLALGTVAFIAVLAGYGVALGSHLLFGLLYSFLRALCIAALAFLFSSRVTAVVALFAAVFLLQLPESAGLISLFSIEWGERLGRTSEYLLPAWSLLPFQSYLRLSQAPASKGLEFYLVGIAHAVNYALICLLLSVWAFRRRSLLPPA